MILGESRSFRSRNESETHRFDMSDCFFKNQRAFTLLASFEMIDQKLSERRSSASLCNPSLQEPPRKHWMRQVLRLGEIDEFQDCDGKES